MGSRDDWFRSPAWSTADQEAFFARLARSRKSAGQYLRIKALALQQATLSAGALELLSRFFQDYPGHFDTAQAFLQQAQCFTALGRLEEAEVSFRAERGDRATARHFARITLDDAAATDSGLSHHGSIGLVESPDPVIHEQIRALAG